MITLADYFGPWLDCRDATDERRENAQQLLEMVNPLLDAAAQAGVLLPINPSTGSQVSGATYGGFRPKSCPQGAEHSSHKDGEGVDVYDPQNQLDAWLTDEILDAYGLYREHPDATHTWCHLTTRAPRSGRRTFKP